MKKGVFASKLAARQAKNPKGFLIAIVLFSCLAGWAASGLKFDSSYEALLPQDSPEVKKADEVRGKTGGTRQVAVAVSGKDSKTRAAFAERLAARLKKIDMVRYVDVKLPVDFFQKRALWMMDEASLDELIPALEEAIRASKWQANPMNLHLDEEKDKAALEAAWKRVEEIVKPKEEAARLKELSESEDGKYTFVLVIPHLTKFNNVGLGKKFLNKMQAAVDNLNPAEQGLAVTFAGNLTIMQEQNKTMIKDLQAASAAAFIIGIILVAVSLRRVGAPFLIGTALLCGVVWTFAFARIAIGHVNIITGFLVSVIIGLGIDFGIHLFMRVQQGIRFSGLSTEDAVVEAVKATFPPALTSALTTAGTFFSFVLADFRGFSEFGLIAGVGVILTLMSSFLVLPVLLLIFKGKPSKKTASPILLDRSPMRRSIAWGVVAFMAVVVVYGVINVKNVNFKNNFRELRGVSEATEFTDYVDKNLGSGFNPAVFVAKNIDDAAKIRELALEQKQTGIADGRASRIGKVLSPSDLLPRNIDSISSKIARIKDILDDPKLDRAEEQGGRQAEDLRRAREMAASVPWILKDVPDAFTRRLMSQDKKEYLVYIWPDVRNDSDVQAVSWEDELEHLSAALSAAGIRHQKADESLMLSWIYKTILKDGMPLLAVAAAVVFVFLLLDFRRLRPTLLITVTLSCGMALFVGIIHALGLDLNMFNMIVLPSIIGIGVDNAVHIYHRYIKEGPGSVKKVIRTTGVAAFLASTTTAVGFGTGVIAHNVGLQTLGAMAVLGIMSVFFASTLFFPCFLTLLEPKAEKK